AEAVAGAHAVYADVWVSMGDEETADERRAALEPYRIDDALLDRAAPDAIALHCLPAHPGEEITAEVLYGPRQRIWDQAENRRHTQDILSDIEQLVGRSRKDIESAASEARVRATRSRDRVLKQVDKARRRAGVGSFPILGYDDLTAAQIVDRVVDLTAAQLRK